MTQPELCVWLLAHGYKLDKWGHYIKTHYSDGRKYRIKMQAISCRKDIKRLGWENWIHLGFAYYKNLHVEGHTLCGFTTTPDEQVAPPTLTADNILESI